MSPRFKGQWPPSLFKLMLMIALLGGPSTLPAAGSRRSGHLSPATSHEPPDVDPMEPCYLANNRASESLTISESTPVGTVVGELMVNGDSSTNGNIQLSIRMPNGYGSGSDTSRQAATSAGNQRQQTNGYNSPSLPLAATKRLGFLQGSYTDRTATDSLAGNRMNPSNTVAIDTSPGRRSARDLSNLIELMPPLSIENETNRLILAKKLDRENLDKYFIAGGYQAGANSLSQSSSSASLTVHVKCQLKNKIVPESPNATQSGGARGISTKNSNINSIIIPIHLIVTDENDNWPVFINAPYIIDLNETIPVGSLLPGNEIVAVDNDQQGPLSTIEYSIVAGSIWSDSFAFLNPLDSRSLIVKDNRLLDYEGQSKIMLKVMARDQGEPPNWAITSLYINLFDNDDLNPTFFDDKYYGYVKENRPGEIIELMPKRLMARDGDKTVNSPIMYSFYKKTNHSIHFDLDADLGRLSLKKTLPEDLATTRQPFCLLVKASQIDDPQRWTLTMINMRLSPPHILGSRSELEQLLTIGDSQKNEQAFLSANGGSFRFLQSNFTVEVSESAPPGFTVTNLKASYHQPKDSTIDEVVYHLLDDEFGYFNLDRRTGRLTLNRSIDYELYRYLSVRILATHESYDFEMTGLGTDQDSNAQAQAIPSLSSNIYPKLACDLTRININIINQNDHKPEFSHEQYNFRLSVSDLIANFDLDKVYDEQLDNLTSKSKILSKRFGEFDLDESNDEPLNWRAMQLGQIYCADRDFGDKVKLELIGSKANLFHLTQDGRFYLPLVNISSKTSGLTSGTRRSDAPLWPHTKTINNRFASRSFHSSRRMDYQPAQEPPDHEYLNYLLGELSNLGRLRLKVLASDDGQPQVYQSTSLIVITVISIDNFILQRAPQLPKESSLDAALQLTNQTSYDTNRQLDLDRESTKINYTNQLMMIPTTSGRSYVQINPDIISNLIVQSSLHLNDLNSSKSESPGLNFKNYNTSRSASDEQHNLRNASGNSDTTYNGQTMSKFHPPSLLLVDDDGAKFVAMPAAIEVYNQQVQEAADQLQARQKSQAFLHDSTKPLEDENSFWQRVKSYFGFSKDSSPSTGSLYWVNISTAIMLHLISFVVVVTLVSKIRSSFRRNGRSNFWPPNFPRFPCSGNQSGGDPRSDGGILGGQQITGSYGIGACVVPSEGSSDGSSGYAFSRRQSDNLQYVNSLSQSSSGSDNSKSTSSNNYLVGKPSVTSGVIVSAMSQGCKTRDKSSNLNVERTDAYKQQPNLFGHLKLTLNKMLDSSDPNEPCVGQVTIKALDSDTMSFGSFKSIGRTSELRSHSSGLDAHQIQTTESIVGVKTNANLESKKPVETNKSSTFVGNQNTSSSFQHEDEPTPVTTVVSINVPAPKPNVKLSPNVDLSRTKKANRGVAGLSSSSSSVISLVSMSSSISNKISAAVERTNDMTTASDASSLDSTSLFNGMSTNLLKKVDTPRSHQTSPMPAPPPPPPPPPPSLVQIGIDTPSIQSLSLSSIQNNQKVESKPFSCPPTEPISSNARRPLPQNPVHVRLRQQAAAIPEQMSSDSAQKKSAIGSQGSLSTDHKKSYPAPKPIGSNRRELEKAPQPPTPPPLPVNSNSKTVSPTTSVDRGYESFQSYTSSQQQQQQPQQQRFIGNYNINNNNYLHNSQQTDLNDSGVAQTDNHLKHLTSRNLPAIPSTVKSVSSSLGGSMLVSGRKMQRKLQTPQVSTISQGNLQAGENKRCKSIEDMLERGREADRVKRSSRTLALGAARSPIVGRARGSRPLNTTNSSRPLKQGVGPMGMQNEDARSLRQQTRRSTGYQPSGHVDYETEDDDFYYCYPQANNLIESNTIQPLKALVEYASHAYNQHPLTVDSHLQTKLSGSSGMGAVQKGEFISSRSQSQLLRLSEIDLNLNGVGSNIYPSHSPQHSLRQQRHQQAYLQTTQNAVGKKQLTWSDQVTIA